MPHYNVIDAFLHERKLTDAEWFTALEARKRLLVSHMKEVGQTKLEDVRFGNFPNDPGRELKTRTRIISEDPTRLNASTRAVWLFDLKTYRRDGGFSKWETHVIYGFNSEERWIVVDIKSPARFPDKYAGGAERTANLRYANSIMPTLQTYDIAPSAVIKQLGEVVKNNSARRRELFEISERLRHRVELEDAWLWACKVKSFKFRGD
jgi:hypothetical protein